MIMKFATRNFFYLNFKIMSIVLLYSPSLSTWASLSALSANIITQNRRIITESLPTEQTYAWTRLNRSIDSRAFEHLQA